MGFFDTVKDIFTKTEITEESFEYESIDSYLAKQKAKETLGLKEGDAAIPVSALKRTGYEELLCEIGRILEENQ